MLALASARLEVIAMVQPDPSALARREVRARRADGERITDEDVELALAALQKRSPRQWEVLVLALAGLLQVEIAACLDISPPRVSQLLASAHRYAPRSLARQLRRKATRRNKA